MKQKALRDSNNNPVFVKNNGEYSYNFPKENIVNRNTNLSGYTVYFFVSRNKDNYVELSANFKNEKEALNFATNVYGKEIEITDNIFGEVFEVEIHNN